MQDQLEFDECRQLINANWEVFCRLFKLDLAAKREKAKNPSYAFRFKWILRKEWVYQVFLVSWGFLNSWGALGGGYIADDMGLGKVKEDRKIPPAQIILKD
jgi:hypothetical protein